MTISLILLWGNLTQSKDHVVIFFVFETEFLPGPGEQSFWDVFANFADIGSFSRFIKVYNTNNIGLGGFTYGDYENNNHLIN